MRYWLFLNNQVHGPYEPDDLSQLPSYSPEALVCPEGRKGTHIGDWQRAGMVPELQLSLLKATQLSPAARGGDPASALFAGLPPEPTLKDLAALGSLQEKMNLMENTVSRLQGDLRLKDTEISGLHVELGEKSAQAAELLRKLESLEGRLADVGSNLRDNLAQAVAAERSVETNVETHERTLKDVSAQLSRLQSQLSEVGAIKEDVRRLEEPLAEVKRLREDLRRMEESLERVESRPAAGGSAPLAAPLLPEPSSPSAGESQGAARPIPLPPPLTPASPPAGDAGFGTSFPPTQPPVLGLPPMALPPAMEPVVPAEPAPVIAPPPAPGPAPRRGRGMLVMAGIAGITVLGAGGAYMLGLGPFGKKQAAEPPPEESPSLPAPPPPAQPLPPPPPPEPTEEELKARALEMARQFPLPSGKTLGAELEGPNPPPGLPWIAEKLPGTHDGYQVNFYPPKGKGKTKKPLEFAVTLSDGGVKGLNAAARKLLAAKPPSAAAPAGDPDAAALFGDEPAAAPPAGKGAGEPSLFEAESPPPAAAKKPSARKRAAKKNAEPEPSLDDLLLPGVPKPAAVAPKTPKPAKAKAPAAEPAADDEKLLDDLLGP